MKKSVIKIILESTNIIAKRKLVKHTRNANNRNRHQKNANKNHRNNKQKMKEKQVRKEYAKHGHCNSKMISFRADEYVWMKLNKEKNKSMKINEILYEYYMMKF